MAIIAGMHSVEVAAAMYILIQTTALFFFVSGGVMLAATALIGKYVGSNNMPFAKTYRD